MLQSITRSSIRRPGDAPHGVSTAAPPLMAGCTPHCPDARVSHPAAPSERPRSSQYLFRILATFIILVGSSFATFSQDSLLKLIDISPSADTSISSFEFTLNFDISDVISTYGEKDYGIGCNGSYLGIPGLEFLDLYAGLYEGEGDSKKLLAKALTENIDGQSPDFKIGPSITISFPGIIPTPGKTYTVAITNGFLVFEAGSSRAISNTLLNYQDTPLTTTFTVVGGESDILRLEDVSIINGSDVKKLSTISYLFNSDFDIVTGSHVNFYEDGNFVTSTSDLTKDGKNLIASFDEITLLNGRSYSIELPANTVQKTGNPNDTNTAYTISVKGIGFNKFGYLSSTPSDGEKGLFNTIETVFNLPEGYELLTDMGSRSNFNATLYINDIIEENRLETLRGTLGADGKSISWPLNILSPSTKYILHIPSEQFSAWKSRTIEDYANEEFCLSFYSPSIEESGFPPMELGEPVIGKHDGGGEVLHNGDAVDYLDLIEIAPVEYFYKGKEGTNNFRLYHDTNKLTGYLYDITSGTPELIKEVSLSCVQRETTMFEYGVISVPLKSVFFEGHRYRFVIPEGEFTILYPLYFNYVRSPEYSIEFEGATPTEVELLSCSWQEGEERSSVGNVVWTFKGKFELNPEAQAQTLFAKSAGKYNWLLTSTVNASGNTQVVAHIYTSSTGEPLPLRSGDECTIILPEGAVYYPTDPDITNKEISITVKGMDVKQVDEPEFVNVEVCINGFHTSKFEGVKGRKLTLNLVPDGNWTVTGLSRDGDDGIIDKFEDGVYTTPALSADTRIEATVEYAGVLINETATSVMEIPDMNVKVYSDGENIIVEGMNVGDMVAVYSVNGMLIAEREMTTADHNMQITIARGQVYIVRVNNQAVKIQH